MLLGIGPYAQLISTMLFSMGHLMRMSICHNPLDSLTLIILTMFANSRKLFMVSNKLPELGTLNYALTFFTSAHSYTSLFIFERVIFMLTS